MHHKIGRHMTKSSHTIGRHASLAEAREVMNDHCIRHLPVLDGGVLVGLVSQRDIHLIESLKDVDSSEVTVEEAMSEDILAAAPGDSVHEVAARMAERKAGSVLVIDHGRIQGIFTTVDALKALALADPKIRRPSGAVARRTKRRPRALRAR